MPQAKHIQMDSDLLETHTSVFFFSLDHIALIAHCEGNQSLLWARGVLVVCKILSFFCNRCSQVHHDKELKIGNMAYRSALIRIH